MFIIIMVVLIVMVNKGIIGDKSYTTRFMLNETINPSLEPTIEPTLTPTMNHEDMEILLAIQMDLDDELFDDKVHEDGHDITWQCPHCGQQYIASYNELNCHIFRCGYLNNGGPEPVQIPPHSSKAQIDRWIHEGKIVHGCGKPFRITPKGAKVPHLRVEKCGYI